MKECIERKGKMSLKEYMGHCVAQGGNWTAMMMSGLRDLSETDCKFKKVFEAMPDKSYEFQEVMKILEPLVDLSDPDLKYKKK